MSETTIKINEATLLDLPSDWSKKTIDDVAIINRENVNPTKEFPEEEFTYIDISNVESGGTGQIVDPKKIIGKEAPSRARRVIQKDDVILSTVRPYLKSYTIVPQEYDGEICSTGYVVLTAKDKTDPHFLLYSCLTRDVQEQFKRMMRGANYPALNLGHVKQTTVPYPPFKEQRKIASILTAIQDAIEQTEAVIQATRELKKSMMKHLFTYGPVPEDQTDRVETQETDIGNMPKEWDFLELEKVATLKRGKDLTKKNMKDGETPVVGSSGVIGRHNESVSVGPGVIVGRSGSVGNLTYINEDYWPHNTSLFVEDFNGNDPKFIYYLLHRLDFIKFATGVSVPTLNRNFVHGIKIGVPSKSTQRKIVKVLDSVENKLVQETDKKKSLKVVFNSLLENLMTAKIRVV